MVLNKSKYILLSLDITFILFPIYPFCKISQNNCNNNNNNNKATTTTKTTTMMLSPTSTNQWNKSLNIIDNTRRQYMKAITRDASLSLCLFTFQLCIDGKCVYSEKAPHQPGKKCVTLGVSSSMGNYYNLTCESSGAAVVVSMC